MRWPRHNAFENQSQQIIESRDVLFKELNMEVIHRCETPPNITTVHHNIMVHLSAIIFVMLVLRVQQPRGGASAPQEMWDVQLPVKAIGANPKSLQQIISLDTINFGDDCEHGHTNFASWDDILDTTNFGEDCEHGHTTFASWDDILPMINNIKMYALEADPTIYTTIQAM